MTKPRLKVYLAGPDVFEPNPIKVGERLKAIASRYGFDPLFPFDNEVSPTESSPSQAIFKANVAMLLEADLVLANLNAFREGPEPDSGTVWECAYATALGKPVFGYLASGETLLERVDRLQGLDPSRKEKTDRQGKAIEDFGGKLNCMLENSVTELVVGNFETACIAAAKHFDKCGSDVAVQWPGFRVEAPGVVSVPTFYGQQSCEASDEQIARLERDADTVYAELLGLPSAEDYLSWRETYGSVLCSAKTTKNRPCRNNLVGMTNLSPAEWLSVRATGGFCPQHGGPAHE